VSVAGEDVQNQGCAIENLDALSHLLLQLALLSRRQLVIKDDEVEAQIIVEVLKLLYLTLAYVCGRVDPVQALSSPAHHLNIGGPGELCQFIK